MVGILIVTHGKFGHELLKSAELIIGQQENVLTLGLEHGDSIEELHQKVRNSIEKLDEGDGVLVLTDLFGGSPSNAAATNMEHLNFHSLTGVNLPMLIEALSMRECVGIEELVESAYKAGYEGIKNIGEILNNNL